MQNSMAGWNRRVPPAMAAEAFPARTGSASLLRLQGRPSAYGTPLHGEGLLEPARGEKPVVPEDIEGRPVGADLSFVEDDRPLAEFEDHVQVVAGEDLCVPEIPHQFDELSTGERVEPRWSVRP